MYYLDLSGEHLSYMTEKELKECEQFIGKVVDYVIHDLKIKDNVYVRTHTRVDVLGSCESSFFLKDGVLFKYLISISCFLFIKRLRAKHEIVRVVAHELRHIWQHKNKIKNSKIKQGKYPILRLYPPWKRQKEFDCEEYASKIWNKFRKGD